MLMIMLESYFSYRSYGIVSNEENTELIRQ